MVSPTRTPTGVQNERVLAERAYDHIRDRIVTVQLTPGAPIDEEALMAAAGVGRTPVREALKRLSLERLVAIYPRRGTFVTEINISDERWLTEVRIPLEGLAASLAATRATEADREEFRLLYGDVEDKKSNPPRAASEVEYLLGLDTRMHRLVYRAAHNPHLEATLTQYLNLAVRIWYFCLDRLPAIEQHVLDQWEIIGAILARDPAAAQTAAEHHLRDCTTELRGVL